MVEEAIVPLLFGVVSIAVGIGFLGERIFSRTGVPDVVPIMILGLLVGPILNVINPDPLLSIAPLFGAVALLIILFHAGLNLDFYTVLKQAPRAALLAIMSFGFATLFVSLIGIYALNHPPLIAILLGSIVGGSSSIIVIPFLEQMRVGEKIRTLLSLESTMTDILAVVVALTIIRLLQIGPNEVTPVAQIISARFSVGVVIGLLLGLIWLITFPKISKDPYNYMMTLFIAFLTYSVSEFLGGSGPLSALVFGLVLGNGRPMSQIFRFERQVAVSTDINRFNSEMSFLVRSIFFVYIGIISSIGGFQLTLVGILISGLLLVSRIIAVPIVTFRSDMVKHKALMTVMLPRGLGAAVLASLPFTLGIPGTESFVGLAFVIILSTITITVVGTILMRLRTRSSDYKRIMNKS